MKGLPDSSTVRADFDRIAYLSEEAWSHNSHYHTFLLQHMPRNCEQALEIGCGTGTFARSIAQRAQHVLALDLAPQMIRIARERSTTYQNIDFQCADIMREELADEHFDYIASIATLHHLPLAEVLVKVKSALKPNGTLVVLDLFQTEGIADTLRSLVAIPISILLKAIKNGRTRPSSENRDAWEAHGKHDVYMKYTEIREICATILPGAHVQKHLFWRYSIVWKKPLTDPLGLSQ